MVRRWGMTEAVGLVSVLGADGAAGWGPWTADGPSEKTRELVDDEVRRLTDIAYEQARALLAEHRPQLDSLAAALLASETLDDPEAYASAGLPPAQHAGGPPPTHPDRKSQGAHPSGKAAFTESAQRQHGAFIGYAHTESRPVNERSQS